MPIRKTTQWRVYTTGPIQYSFLMAHMALGGPRIEPFVLTGSSASELPCFRNISWPLLPIAARFAHLLLLARALLENRSTRIAEIGRVLPQAIFNSRRVRNVTAAESEGIGRAGGPLLRSPLVVLSKSGCCEKRRQHRDTRAVGFRSHIGSFLWLSLHLDRITTSRLRPAESTSTFSMHFHPIRRGNLLSERMND